MYMTFNIEKENEIDRYYNNIKSKYAFEDTLKIFNDSLTNPKIEYDKALSIINSKEFDDKLEMISNPRWSDDLIITRWKGSWKDSFIYPDKEFIKTTFDVENDYLELEGIKYSLDVLSGSQKESLLSFFCENIDLSDEEGYPLASFEYCIGNNEIIYLKWNDNEYGNKNENVRKEYVGADFFLNEHCIRNHHTGNKIINVNDIKKAIQSIHFAFSQGVSGKHTVTINDNTYFILCGYIAGDTSNEVDELINIFSVEIIEDFDEYIFKLSFEKFQWIYLWSFIIMMVLSWGISIFLVYPIKKLEEVATKIANNDFDGELKIKSNDEIGSLAKSISIMKVNLKTIINQLNDEVEKVKELESLRKDFINQFTHEMKTPLGIINGYSELIEEAETDEEKQKYLDIINRETVRINDLVQAMLKLSRLESGKVELNKEQLDLEDIASEVIDEFEVLLMKKNIKVEVDVIDKNIIGDKQQLMTVIRNFISNAIKHTDTKIVVTIDKGVKVFNEGKPIDEDKLNGIWYTFVTHDKTGTGLGLAICRSILELHNYQYGVTNKENGVEFYFFE